MEEKVPEPGYYQQHFPSNNYHQPTGQGIYFEEKHAPTYYEEEKRSPAYINDDGLYKHHYEHEHEEYGPEAREGPSYSEEKGYNEPMQGRPVASAMRAHPPTEDSYIPYRTDPPAYADYDNAYEDPQTSAPFSEFTTKVQRVSAKLGKE